MAPRLFTAIGARINPQVEWVEIQVKSVLNRVQGMGFDWSINPYRGCEHACVYCQEGGTRVLLGDGTTKRLGDIRVGDEIYGTQRKGYYRWYVRTRVLAHWSVKRPAYRVLMEDGTELIAGGDHRFLSNRGWKFVTGSEQGPLHRPHLTVNNRLLGPGDSPAPPLHDGEYKRGYLCGLIRGDGLLRTYHYDRVGRRHGDVHQFRLALADEDALVRARQYLMDSSIPTSSFLFYGGSATTRQLTAIRTSARGHVAQIEGIVGWPTLPSSSWMKGFLAGIFDAEGSYSSAGILRIPNTDPVVINWIIRGFQMFGFDFTIESRARDGVKPIQVVRLRGGLSEQLEFFGSFDPAIKRKCGFAGRAIKNSPERRILWIEPIGHRELFDITTGTGDFIANGVISHNCFARKTHWYLDQDGVNNWSSRIFVKVNAPEILRKELAKPSWTHEQVHLGTATDPYQPAEGAYRVTRRILEALRDYRTPVAIVTKSTMVLRDKDVLGQLARGPGATVCFSITTVDPELGREIEPDVPPPQRRLEVMRELADAGVDTAVLLAPVIPGITDAPQQLEAVVKAAKRYRAGALWTNALHLGDVTRQAFFDYLVKYRPTLVPEYERLYRGKYAPAAYRRRVQEVVASLKRRAGFAPRENLDNEPEPTRPRASDQLNLFAVQQG
ncbi:MAG TPA: radical SAM protein [bacterium]|jgi:DNA repair photolyase|nr:radical SAM protein [bacterium]